MANTVVEYVDDTYVGESMARRLIAKDLKIVTGTIAIAASAFAGSAGEDFDYTTYGSRFLWAGFTARAAGTIVDTLHAGVYGVIYNPVLKKLYLTVGGADANRMKVADANEPYADLTIQFVLLVFEGGATAGTGIG